MSDKVKLIIEIDEHQYEICKQALKDPTSRPITECEFEIAVGTPLDGMTNGEVIQAVLNPFKICIHEYSVHVYMTEKDFLKGEYQMNCDASLWNAPYQKGGEEV